MTDDERYLEATPGYNAYGSELASPGDECGDVFLAGFSAAFDCALPKGHSCAHEDAAGTSWGQR